MLRMWREILTDFNRLLEDVRFVRHTPCSKINCGKKSVFNVIRYYSNEDSDGIIVTACHDHILDLVKSMEEIENDS